jgi:hypothetical protein
MTSSRSSLNPFVEWVKEMLDEINDPRLAEDEVVLRRDNLHQILYLFMGEDVLRQPRRDIEALQDLTLTEWLQIKGVLVPKKTKTIKKKTKPCSISHAHKKAKR